MDDKKIKIDDDFLDEKDKKKKSFISNKVKYILIIIGILLVVGLSVFFIKARKNTAVKNAATGTHIDENSYNQSRIMRVDLNQIKSIDFDLGSSDVRIQRSPTNPYIEYTNLFGAEDAAYKLDVSFEQGVLKLKSVVEGKELYMKDKIPIVRIFMPAEGGIEEIKGTIKAGDVKIDDLEVKNFDLKIKSGNISLKNSFFQGSIENESGSISLERNEIYNTKLTTTSGDIRVLDSKLGNRLDFQTATGDIIVEARDSIDNYNITAALDVGNFILGNISYRNIKDGYVLDNKAKNNITLRTKIGDINFNKGEGASVEKEEYLTKESKVKEKNSNALEKNVKRTEKENKELEKKKSEEKDSKEDKENN